jgi:photosystem II stability/assembly factor-like uncharacterized protein
MKKLFVVLMLLVAMNASGQWVYQYTAGQYSNLNAIHFPSENTGYAVGEQPSSPRAVFLKTTNGGTNWIDMSINLSFETMLIGMTFLDENTGYICGRSVDIYKTTNGGINWLTIQVPYFGNQTWVSIKFLDMNIGFIAGRYGMRSKTTNGGLNWTSMDTTWSDINDICFLNVNTGFMAETSSTILKTTNGGTNWTATLLIDTIGGYYDLYKIDFNNNNTGYIVGSNTVTGAVFKTTDNGNTWKNILITPYGLYSIKVVNNTMLYAGSKHNIVYNSSNSGLTWNNQTVPTTKGEIFSIYFTNNSTGYLTVGNEIYKTTNGGTVFVSNISTETPSSFSLSQNYPNPFNPTTKIKFNVAKTGEVKIIVFDVTGREVQTLVNESLKPGTYEAAFDGSQFTSGIYFYRLQANDFTETKKMTLIK